MKIRRFVSQTKTRPSAFMCTCSGNGMFLVFMVMLLTLVYQINSSAITTNATSFGAMVYSEGSTDDYQKGLRVPHRQLLGVKFASAAPYPAINVLRPSSTANMTVASCFNTTRPIRIGVVGNFGDDIGDLLTAGVNGLQIAMEVLNSKGGVEGRTVEIVTASTDNVPSRMGEIIDRMMANPATEVDVMAFTPLRAHIDAAKPSLKKHNLMLIAGQSGDRKDFEQFDESMVIVSPVPDVEIEAVVRVLVLAKQLRRISMITTYGETYGNDLVPYVTKLLSEFGLELTFVYTVDNPTVPIAKQIADSKSLGVQAVIVCPIMQESSGIALTLLILSNPDIQVASVGLAFALVHNVYQQAPFVFRPDRVVSTHFSPFTTDTRFGLVRSVRRDAVPAYNKGVIQLSIDAYEDRPIEGQFMTCGYGIGLMLTMVFEHIGANGVTAQTLKDAIFGRKVYAIPDWAFGPLDNKDCLESPINPPDMMCKCNVGGRFVYISSMTTYLRYEMLLDQIIRIGIDVCIRSSLIQSPLIQLVSTPLLDYYYNESLTAGHRPFISKEAESIAMTSASEFIAGDRAGYINVSTSPSSRVGIILPLNYSGLDTLVDAEANRLITVAVGGVYAEDVTKAPGRLSVVLDPLYTVPLLHPGFSPRVVYLMPTLEQEIHALASVYAFRGGMRIVTTVSNDPDFVERLAEKLRQSMHTFGSTVYGVSVVSSIAEAVASGTIGESSSAVLLHGIATEADVVAISVCLARNPTAQLLIPFHHVALWYDVFALHVREEDRPRVVFATSFPNWNPTSTSVASQTNLMQSFYRAVKLKKVRGTPRGLHGFLVQRLLANIVERIPSKLTADSFLTTLFAVSVIVLDPKAFTAGPLSNVPCSEIAVVTNCETNIGARYVEVRSLYSSLSPLGGSNGSQNESASMLLVAGATAKLSTAGAGENGHSASPSSSLLSQEEDGLGASPSRHLRREAFEAETIGTFVFTSGVIEYQPLPEGDGVNVLAVAIGVVGAALVATIFSTAMIFVFRTGRDHSNAPRDGTKAFTVVFTDIQSSTNLWSRLPQQMATYIEVHNKLLRNLISKHKGYEVKTIGDSFMVAFKDPDDAIRFSYATQHEFYECKELASGQVEEEYKNFDLERREVVPIKNLSVDLPDEEYMARWSGIRVRIGIHTDVGTIKKDPVSQRYDYFGNVSNIAARVEAVGHGGQVCFTKQTFEALALKLSPFKRSEGLPRCLREDGPLYYTLLEPTALKGVPEKVQLYQLECIRGRVFPPLAARGGSFDSDSEEGERPPGEENNSGNKPSEALLTVNTFHGLDNPMGLLVADRNQPHQARKPAYLPDEIRATHVLLSIATMFSTVQPKKRIKELNHYLSAWNLEVTTEHIKVAKTWGAFRIGQGQEGQGAVLGTSAGAETYVTSSRPDYLRPDELLKGLAYSLANEDGFFAAAVYLLSRRLSDVASVSLKKAPLPRSKNDWQVTDAEGLHPAQRANVSPCRADSPQPARSRTAWAAPRQPSREKEGEPPLRFELEAMS